MNDNIQNNNNNNAVKEPIKELIQEPPKQETAKEAVKANGPVLNANKPPLVLVREFQKMERAYSHSDLERIYRLKIGRRKGLDIWIVDGAKVRRELYTDFIFGGNDQRYKFIPFGEIWIDNAISVEELEFTLIHEIFEREKMIEGLTYAKAHELATQEELKARINKTESIDELRERWYKVQGIFQKEKDKEKDNKSFEKDDKST